MVEAATSGVNVERGLAANRCRDGPKNYVDFAAFVPSSWKHFEARNGRVRPLKAPLSRPAGARLQDSYAAAPGRD